MPNNHKHDVRNHCKALLATKPLVEEMYPKGFATLGESAMLRRQVRQATGKPRGHRSPRKIDVTRKLTVVSVSVVTLIRTDTTLDHSQKAEKV